MKQPLPCEGREASTQENKFMKQAILDEEKRGTDNHSLRNNKRRETSKLCGKYVDTSDKINRQVKARIFSFLCNFTLIFKAVLNHPSKFLQVNYKFTTTKSCFYYLCGTEAFIFSNLRLILDNVAFMEEVMSVLKSFRMALVSLFNEFTFDSHCSISL